MSKRTVVITGLGAVSPAGLGVEELWGGLVSGKSSIGKIKAFDAEKFPCQIAGEVPYFKIRDYVPKSLRKTTKLMSRDIELAVIAADEAFESSGLITKGVDAENVNIDPKRTAINLGAGLISCDLVELAPAVGVSSPDGKFDIHKWGKDGIEALTPLWLLKYLPNMLACHIGIIHDIQGNSNSITCAEASSHLAIGEAAEYIQRSSADVALAGGGEAKVNPIVFLRQCLLKRTADKYNNSPDTACRPFDKEAAGCVFGEGAGMVVLEEQQRAVERGAKIYAEVVGFGQSSNINPRLERLEKGAKGTEIAILKALAQAQIKPEQLDLIIPHGTAVPDDDAAEAEAIKNALGEAAGKIPALATKGLISNTGAAGGAMDVIAAVMAMEKSLIPASKNCDSKFDGCELNISNKPVEQQVNYALCCSYTYGGQTAALVLKKYSESK